ncbi:MAG: ATPase, T2SS/T4P/T4SS family [Candidatus Omnitrophota bacterium]
MAEENLPLEKNLVAQGLISAEQLKLAKEEAKKKKISLEKALINLGMINNPEIASVLAGSLNVPYIDLVDYLIEQETIKLVPQDLAKKYCVIPLFKVGNTLTLAMADPTDIIAIDEVHRKCNLEIDPVISINTQINPAIDQYYGVSGDMEKIIGSIEEDDLNKMIEKLENMEDIKDASLLAEEAPIIRLVNLLIAQAVKDKASDIHIEPEEKLLRVRFRIDGILYEIPPPPKYLMSGIISRVKILSKMDIAEKRAPQDGRFSLKMENKTIDLRVSSFPTVYGENIVMRLLDKGSIMYGLTDLGFAKDSLEIFDKMIKRSYGIILVTGPTGSGKTTTLYAALQGINSLEKNIITVEDPVEYHLPLIRQCQVNPKAGLTFASGLRAIVRQDPNVIMVGEIRDLETVEIAIHSALTGQLVFSTLHTNDAPSAITRLIDMGAQPFLIASSLIGVVAQRLIRVLCDNCKQAYKPTPELLRDLGFKEGQEVTFYKPVGCRRCKDIGYTGRIGIYEIMVCDDQIRRLTVAKVAAVDIKRHAQGIGMKTLREDGLVKAMAGITSLEEVLRVTQEE